MAVIVVCGHVWLYIFIWEMLNSISRKVNAHDVLLFAKSFVSL